MRSDLLTRGRQHLQSNPARGHAVRHGQDQGHEGVEWTRGGEAVQAGPNQSLLRYLNQAGAHRSEYASDGRHQGDQSNT